MPSKTVFGEKVSIVATFFFGWRVKSKAFQFFKKPEYIQARKESIFVPWLRSKHQSLVSSLTTPPPSASLEAVVTATVLASVGTGLRDCASNCCPADTLTCPM
uniref:Uncharacterized protein n=1 Tax=Anguilla anguilla TaxID=7936 RepID=A0A0E9XG38_ANGAN